MAQQTINIGSNVNSGGGDAIRTAFKKINDNFTELYGDITSLEDGHIVTDVQGSVYADDSTLLVDGANGSIPASVLTGALPAIDGSALTGISGGGGLADLVDDTTPQLGGNLDLNNFDITGTGDIPAANLTGTLPALDGSSLTGVTASSIAFADVTGTPTTIAGYGITDAYTQTQVDTAITNATSSIVIPAGSTQSVDVVAADSTLLIDSVNGTINSSALTKPIALADDEKITFGDGDDLEIFHNSSNGNTIIQETNNNLVIKGSNLFLQSAGSEYFLRGIANGAVTLYYDNVAKFNTSASGIKIEAGVEEKFATLTGATGTVTHDCDNGHIFYHTGAAADWTANFTNLDLTAEYATTLSIVINQGATAYIPSAVEIGGVAQTILWQGGSAPSGTADGTDVVAFSVLNDGGTYVVMGQLVGFS
jgi:hypothetical protein